MRRGRTIVAGLAVAVAVLTACAGETGDAGAGGRSRPPTTDRSTSTARPTTTTIRVTPATTVPAADDIPTEGDLEACAPLGNLIAVWGAPTPADPVQLQTAVEAVLDVAWHAEDAQLVAALDQARTAIAALDVDGTSAAMIAYGQRCTTLGAPGL